MYHTFKALKTENNEKKRAKKRYKTSLTGQKIQKNKIK
jgi:hypothetical protein